MIPPGIPEVPTWSHGVKMEAPSFPKWHLRGVKGLVAEGVPLKIILGPHFESFRSSDTLNSICLFGLVSRSPFALILNGNPDTYGRYRKTMFPRNKFLEIRESICGVCRRV